MCLLPACSSELERVLGIAMNTFVEADRAGMKVE